LIVDLINLFNNDGNGMLKRIFIVTLLFIQIFFLNILSQNKLKLKFSHQRGFYNTPFELNISCDSSGSVIRYTLNGSNPLNSSSAFTSTSPAKILIDPSNASGRDKAPGFILTACITLSDTLASDIITQTYLFPNKIIELSPNNQVPGSGWLVPGSSAQQLSYGLDPRIYNDPLYSSQIINAFTSIPTLSLVTDLRNLFNLDSGIYVNAYYHGEEWERTGSLELINPDSSKGFQINCGIRIRGGWSRHPECPKRAFRIFFRSEYGEAKLNYPLFGDEGADEFDKFDIQTSMNYSWSYYGDASNTFLRELFSRDTQRDMGQPYTRGKFYHLYINGTYWGLYQIQERSEATFGETYFGGNQEDYDVIKVNVGVNFDIYKIEATDGTLDKWRELWQAGQDGFVSDERYFKVQGLNPDGSVNPNYNKLLDVDNLIDFELNTFFVGDFDGPVSAWRSNASPNNFYAVYNRVNPDGFKFFRHDAEHSLFYHDWGTDRTGPFNCGLNFLDSNPLWIHQKLSENPHYRLRFADRVFKHFFNNGALTKENNIARINERRVQIETAIIAESARWGDSKVSPPRTKADWTTAVNFITQDYLQTRNSVVLQQLINKGLYKNNLPPQFNKNGGIVEKGFNVELTSTTGDIYYTVDGADPYLQFSSSGSSFSKKIINTSANKKVLIPQSSIGTNWRSDASFDDSSWLICSGDPGGIGYEMSSGYESLISLSLQSYMYQTASNPNNTCYIRIPFEISSEDFIKINKMELQIRVDDGFVAYINGTQVASSTNAPTNPEWNSAAGDAIESDNYISFDLSAYVNVLHSGTNLLAIQGLNYNPQSSDFLILPVLIVGKTAQAGSISPSAIKYSGSIPINKTTIIKARTLIGEDWSPLNEVTFIVDEDLSNLKITELHYHPIDQDTVSDNEYEFIELKNCGSGDLVLTGSSFITGIKYKFGEKNLEPGGFVVLASNTEEFKKRYGFSPYAEYEGQLDNGGEKIEFSDAAGDTIISFIYNDKLPWPVEADGQGYSLIAKSVFGTGNPDSPDYWIRSNSINGSPGMDDVLSDVTENNPNIPAKFELYQNYPNPFNPTTTISYSIPKRSNVKLIIYDVLGREVATLVNEYKPVGKYKNEFNASSLTSGVYFYHLMVGDYISTKKMVLMK
jgi:hypothetical protein